MKRIDGTTRLVGLVGHPLSHSLSPAMHNALYEHLGLNWAYLPFDISDEVGLRRFVALVPSLDCVGFNVTMPFKRDVLELCDEVAMAASTAGAVNTVHVVDGKLIGYNTDGRGLLEALSTEAGFEPEGQDIVIVGAGGAAGAAFVALLLGRARSVTLVNRDLGRANHLLERMLPHLGGVSAQAVEMLASEDIVRGAHLLVNATPAGMTPGDSSPIPVEWLHSGQTVYDMVYGTLQPTALVAGARNAGATACDGLGMLVAQGAMAVDIWNDTKQTSTPRDVMRKAAQKTLEDRAQAVRMAS